MLKVKTSELTGTALDWQRVKKERDTLLTALEDAVECIKWMHGCSAPAEDEIEKAIAEGTATISMLTTPRPEAPGILSPLHSGSEFLLQDALARARECSLQR